MDMHMSYRWTTLRAVLLAATICAYPSQSAAETILIDFNAAAEGGLLQEDYIEDGFWIGVVSGHYDLVDAQMNIDTFGGGYSSVRLQGFGEYFDFLSFDVTQWRPQPDERELDEVAWLTSSNGGYVQITSSGTFDFAGSQWTNVSWIELSVRDPNHDTQQDNLTFDNIRVAVPEPPSAVLLLCGLVLGLRSFRRKAAEMSSPNNVAISVVVDNRAYALAVRDYDVDRI
jgi:hypothetical protein